MGVARIAVIGFVVLAAARPVRAEEPPPVPMTKVELKEQPTLAKHGKVAIYRGEADDKGVAFYLEGLSIATPVGAMLISGDKSAPMNLLVKNDLSRDWDRKVKPEGAISKTQFTTEGPAMFLVTSPTKDKKPYELAIWVGPEVPIHKLQPSPFNGKGKGTPAGGGGGSGALSAVIAIGVVVALIAILVTVMRRKARKGAR